MFPGRIMLPNCLFSSDGLAIWAWCCHCQSLSFPEHFVWWSFECLIFCRFFECCVTSCSLVGWFGCVPRCDGVRCVHYGCCVWFLCDPGLVVMFCILPVRSVTRSGCLHCWVGWRRAEVSTSCGALVHLRLVVLFVCSLVVGWMRMVVHLRIGWKGCCCFVLPLVLVRRVILGWSG